MSKLLFLAGSLDVSERANSFRKFLFVEQVREQSCRGWLPVTIKRLKKKAFPYLFFFASHAA